jgi:hypothetical protein
MRSKNRSRLWAHFTLELKLIKLFDNERMREIAFNEGRNSAIWTLIFSGLDLVEVLLT